MCGLSAETNIRRKLVAEGEGRRGKGEGEGERGKGKGERERGKGKGEWRGVFWWMRREKREKREERREKREERREKREEEKDGTKQRKEGEDKPQIVPKNDVLNAKFENSTPSND